MKKHIFKASFFFLLRNRMLASKVHFHKHEILIYLKTVLRKRIT
jgi:hypothetical protein